MCARTKLIEDSRRPQPRYKGLLHGSAQIIRDEGIGGIYRGLLPVVRLCLLLHLLCFRSYSNLILPCECCHLSYQAMRQGANSAVRFSAYSTLKQSVQGSARPGQQLPSVVTFGIGAIAGIITVCKSESVWHGWCQKLKLCICISLYTDTTMPLE